MIVKPVLLAITFLILISIVNPVDFIPSNAGPWLGDYYKNSLTNIRTSENIYCRWNATIDTTAADIYWYKNGAHFGNITNYSPLPSELTWPVIDKSELTEEQTWNCTVTLKNGTDNISGSDTIYVDYDPLVYISPSGGYTKINKVYNISEDQTYSIIWNTTSTDFIGDSFFENAVMCTTSSIGYGIGTCTPTNSDLGSDKNISTIKVVAFQYDHPRGTQKNYINFTIIPVNDAPDFSVANISINQTTPLNVQINITDEEGNPVNPNNITIWSSPNINGFCSYPHTTNKILINCTAGPLNIGNFTVNITATDTPPVNEFNLIAQNTTKSFNLEIIRVNHIPNITYVSNDSSAQNQNYTIIMNATDNYDNNTLNFTITSSCNLTNPWTNVTTTTNVTGSGNNVTSYGYGIWNGTLTNSHVACRNITVTITDEYGASNSTTKYLNITNINDPPIIEDYSANTGDILNNHYISSLTAYTLTPFRYQINVTDLDLLVTNPLGIDSFNESLRLTTNNSWINQYLNTTTGLINISSVNESVGNYTILVNVTDFNNESNTTIMNIEIKPNAPPEFNQTLNFTCYEYDLFNYAAPCNHNLSQYASDPNENVGDRVANFSENSATFNITNEGLLLFNATQSLVGMHTFNVTITDLRGVSTTAPMYLYIRNTNNRPNITSIEVRIPSKALYYNKTDFNKIPITATDLDESQDVYNDTTNLRYNYENLTFNWTNNNLSQNITGYISINQTTRELIINTTKQSNGQLIQIGSYSINVTAKDNYYNFTGITTIDTSTYTYNFTIYNTTTPPVITDIYPYGDQNKKTVFAWKSILTSEYITYMNVTENQTILFDHLSTDADNSTLTYKWYYDGVQVTSGSTINYNSTTTISNNNKTISFYFGFFEGNPLSTKLHNLTLIVIDGHDQSETDQFTWEINVSDQNRPPVWNQDLQNISLSGARTYRDQDLFACGYSKGFYDPDFDYDGDGIIECNEGSFLLTYTFFNNTGSSNNQFSICDGYANIDVSAPYYNVTENNVSHVYGHRINAEPVQNGTCSVIFNVTDGQHNAYSNKTNFIITVPDEATISTTEVTQRSGTRTITETKTVSVPVPEEIEKPVYIELLLPDMVTVYENNRIEIPLTLINNWNNTLYGINLSYELNNSENFNISFLRKEFYKIDPGEIIKTAMTVEGYRVGGIYEITIIANVTEPPYTDRAKIYLNSIEQSSTGAKLRTLVRFARDLLKANKECQELEEVLNKAEQRVLENDYEEALELLDSIINGCKYLISQEQKKEAPKRIRDIHLELKQEYVTYLALGTAIMFFSVGTVMLFRKKK